jgi:sugar phosphate isomerase/epimerase
MKQTYKTGLQVCSVSESMEENIEGTLEKISKMGYQGIELYSKSKKIPNLPANKLRGIFDELGIEAVNVHLDIQGLRKNFGQIIEDAKTLGMDMITLAVYPEEGRKDADAYRRKAEELEEIGMKCAREHIKFCYHNHDSEFTKFEGNYALDLLLSNTSSKALSLEFDTAFAAIENVDASKFILDRAERIPIIHLKDPEKNHSRPYHYVAVGEGILDVSSVLSACKEVNMEWVIVELGKCRTDRMEAAAMSMKNIKKINGEDI